ncbi:hypothetical protein GG344DRAFT_62412 [Lentinula edodes]|nr:hypothetical protein GG344DRAFT_62412 [Lentinula edodes]
MFSHHSRTSLRFKLSVIFVFGLVCAAFAAAMPLPSDTPVSVFVPRSDVNATAIPVHELKAVRVTVTFLKNTRSTTQEPLFRDQVSAKLQKYLDVVAEDLGFMASITDCKGVPYLRDGLVRFKMTGSGSYRGQMGVTASTAEDIDVEKLTTLRLKRTDGKSKGRVVTFG